MNAITALAQRAVGNPISNRMRQMRDTRELSNLTRQQQVVDDEQERLSSESLMVGQMPRSATPDARSYFDNQNRQGRIAQLYGSLTGKPVNVRDGGVMPAGTGSRSAASRLEHRANDVGSDFDWKMQQMDIEDRINARESAAIAGLRRLEQDPDFDLYSGRQARRANALGDIRRDETELDATSEGTAEANRYLAPGQDARRQQKRWDDREYATDMLPFNKDVIAAQSRLGVADLNAGARVDAARVGADGRVASSAVNTLGRLSTAPTFTPEEVARNQAGVDAVRPLVPSESAGPMKPFPRARLQRFAQEQGLSEQQAIEVLRSHGYAVQ